MIDAKTLLSLDALLAHGVEVEHPNGTKYRLAPLTLGDHAEIVARRKARELRLLNESPLVQGETKRDRFTQRHLTLHRAANATDFQWGDPDFVLDAVELSLRRGGHQCGRAEVDELLADDKFAEVCVDVCKINSWGPFKETNAKPNAGGGAAEPDPFGSPSPSTTPPS